MSSEHGVDFELALRFGNGRHQPKRWLCIHWSSLESGLTCSYFWHGMFALAKRSLSFVVEQYATGWYASCINVERSNACSKVFLSARCTCEDGGDY
jgi:hypothetical protein